MQRNEAKSKLRFRNSNVSQRKQGWNGLSLGNQKERSFLLFFVLKPEGLFKKGGGEGMGTRSHVLGAQGTVGRGRLPFLEEDWG